MLRSKEEGGIRLIACHLLLLPMPCLEYGLWSMGVVLKREIFSYNLGGVRYMTVSGCDERLLCLVYQ